ncbi:MAG: phosphoglucomutase [Betaproteobacteria bacterium RIFCSPLOWO2_02_FULL_62_17]|nr:MAG: phosphoglucomutase [Betaproteobacteria bacterium RIFCSPLOWO2_02_FULL_62_17]
MASIAPEIFKAYDIRGIVAHTLTEEAVRLIGRALGSEARERAERGEIAANPVFAVGRDGRLSGPAFAAALAEGLCAAGADVIDIGMVATPMTYFAAHHLGCGSAVSVTGSHNPPDYNGLKMVLGGVTLAGEAIQSLRRRIAERRFSRGAGVIQHRDIGEDYLRRIAGDIRLARPMRIAVDCGNGVAGATAGELYRRLGCEVVELFCEVDGTFPNHHPDPSRPENLADLIRAVREQGAELGLAFDGDGDRLGVVTAAGRIIYPDRQLMLFAADVLARVPGAQIVYDVKCTRLLAPWISKHGGVPSLWKTGHSFIKARLKETGAPLAGEMSGHIFFSERWYGFDDGQYAGARLLEILSRERDPSGVLDALPDALSTPELNWALAEGEPHRLIAELQQTARFEGSQEVIKLDGLRVEYADGFGLARASNTTPVIVLRFEGDNAAALSRIQAEFRRVLVAAKPGASLPF